MKFFRPKSILRLILTGFALVALPLILESVSLRRARAWPAIAASLLVLGGGYLLRDITVDLGQRTAWVQYQDQFDTRLIDLVRHQ